MLAAQTNTSASIAALNQNEWRNNIYDREAGNGRLQGAKELRKCVFPRWAKYWFIGPFRFVMLSASTFWAENQGNEMSSNGLLFSITYAAKVQATATQTHSCNCPHPLNSRICAYIDQSQLPVKCYARLDISRYKAWHRQASQILDVVGAPFCGPSSLHFTLYTPHHPFF